MKSLRTLPCAPSLNDEDTGAELSRYKNFWTRMILQEFRVPFYVLIFLLAVLGNGLVLVTLVQNKRMRTVTNVFLLNLSLSDLLLAVFCMPFTLIPTLMQNFVFGKAMCILIRYMQGVSVSVCVFTLVSISAERYFAVCQPLRSRHWQTLSHAYKVISLIWVISAVIALPIAIVQRHLRMTRGGHKCMESWESEHLKKFYTLFLDLVLLVLPILLMFFTYGRITIRLFRSSRGLDLRATGRSKGSSASVLESSVRDLADEDDVSCFTTNGNNVTFQPDTPASAKDHPDLLNFLNQTPGFCYNENSSARNNVFSAQAESESSSRIYNFSHVTDSANYRVSTDVDKSNVELSTIVKPNLEPFSEFDQTESVTVNGDLEINNGTPVNNYLSAGDTPYHIPNRRIICMYSPTNVSNNECLSENRHQKMAGKRGKSAVPSYSSMNVNKSCGSTVPPYSRENRYHPLSYQTLTSSIDEDSLPNSNINCSQHFKLGSVPSNLQKNKFLKNKSSKPQRQSGRQSGGMKPHMATHSEEHSRKSMLTTRRTIRMLFTLVLEFFICWTPMYVAQTWQVFDYNSATMFITPHTMNMIHLLGYVSSCCNPITYCFMSKNFRRGFLAAFKSCPCSR